MGGRVRAYGIVGRVCESAAGIYDLDLFDAAKFLEHRLEAPEAPSGEPHYFALSPRFAHHVLRLVIRFGPGLRFASLLDESYGIRTQDPFLRPPRQGERPHPFDFLEDTGDPGAWPVGSEHDLAGDFLESREPLQESLGRDARDVEVQLRMAAEQVEGRVAPKRSAAMRHQD